MTRTLPVMNGVPILFDKAVVTALMKPPHALVVVRRVTLTTDQWGQRFPWGKSPGKPAPLPRPD